MVVLLTADERRDGPDQRLGLPAASRGTDRVDDLFVGQAEGLLDAVPRTFFETEVAEQTLPSGFLFVMTVPLVV